MLQLSLKLAVAQFLVAQEALCILECGVTPETLTYLQSGVQARFVITFKPLTRLVFQRDKKKHPGNHH